MRVTEAPDTVVHFLDDTVRDFNPLAPPLFMSSGVPRSPGLHLSHILGDLYNQFLKKPGQNDSDEYAGHERMALGFAWEHILSWAISQVFPSDRILIHLGEFEKDGILMSPDGLDVMDLCGEEYKCTWKSARKEPPQDFPYWMWQFMSYSHAMEVNKTRLRVFHVNGAYNKDGGGKRCKEGPCIRTWLLEYTAKELRDNWSMIIGHRDEMRKEGKIE